MEFFCDDQEARVRASYVKATLDALHVLPTLSRQIALRHQLMPRDYLEGGFVLLQSWLNALNEIQVTVGAGTVRQIGRRIGEIHDLPPGGVDAALLSLSDLHQANHVGEVGRYESSRLDDGTLVITCRTPYPRQFELGLIEGIVRRKAREGAGTYTVEFREGPTEEETTCVLTVRPAVALDPVA